MTVSVGGVSVVTVGFEKTPQSSRVESIVTAPRGQHTRNTPLPPSTMRLLLSITVCVFLFSFLVVGLHPPPVFEHKADRNYRGTNCEVCQAVVKQTLRKMPQGAPDLSTQKLRRAREQKVNNTHDTPHDTSGEQVASAISSHQLRWPLCVSYLGQRYR